MSESSLTLGANTRAFTIGARAPKSSVLFAASASRSAPRPRGTGSSTRTRRTTSTPPPPPPAAPPPAPPPLPATPPPVPPLPGLPPRPRPRSQAPPAPGPPSPATAPPPAPGRPLADTAPPPRHHPRRPASDGATLRPAQAQRAAACPGAHVRVHDPATRRHRVLEPNDGGLAAPCSPLPAPASSTRRFPLAPRRHTPHEARDAHHPECGTKGRSSREQEGGPQDGDDHVPRTTHRKQVEAGIQPGPESDREKENRRPHLGPPKGSHQLHRPRPAARREPYLAEPLEQRHVQLGFLLVAVEPQLDEHFALRGGHVSRREAIERDHVHLDAAGFAAAEPGQLGAQLRVLPLHHLEPHVGHPTTASSPPSTCPSGTAVNVEPVVPVKRTSR